MCYEDKVAGLTKAILPWVRFDGIWQAELYLGDSPYVQSLAEVLYRNLAKLPEVEKALSPIIKSAHRSALREAIRSCAAAYLRARKGHPSVAAS